MTNKAQNVDTMNNTLDQTDAALMMDLFWMAFRLLPANKQEALIAYVQQYNALSL
jgi:hypothetical protein